MADKYQRVEPTPFDAAPAVEERVADGGGRGAGLVVPALAVLVLLALFVLFALPALVDGNGRPGATDPVAADAPTPDRASPPRGTSADEEDAAPTDAGSPYADAVAARARAEAQELLAELIDVRENLEERGALDWAADAMSAIAETATAGDERYRERAFEEAITLYRDALDDALALEASLPERFARQLEKTDEAVEALDMSAATQALAVARQIRPGDPELQDYQARVDVLPEVADAVAAAQQAEAAAALADAVASLETARDLDDRHRYVASELERLRRALTEQRFNAAMSEGYAALDESDFDRAQARFDRAASLKPGAAEAQAALQELAIARTAAQLAALRRRGERLAAEEDWDRAVEVFEEALAIDGSLRFAREGLARAKPRAALAKDLSAIIDQPGRLVDDAILREARDTLARARAVADPGDKLREQVARVATIVEVASTPLPVELRSDGETLVTVYKVARLGSFESRTLELRPGEYTAVGTRRGYRDVRVVFTVAPGDTAPVYIACNEPI